MKLLWIVPLLAFIVSLNAQGGDTQLKTGLDLMYNFKMQPAREQFDAFKKKYPNDPRGCYYLSLVSLWEFLGSSNQADFTRFIALSDSAIDYSEEAISTSSTDPYAYNILGMTHAARSIAFGKNEDYMSMIWAGKKSFSALETSLELKPDLHDNHLGIGLFKFGLSQVPATFSYLLKMIGFEGTVAEAIQHLQKAANSGNVTRTEAQYYLSFVYSDFLNQPEKAEAIVDGLRKKYPQNYLFAYSYAVVQIKLHRPEKAVPVLEDILNVKAGKYKELFALSRFLLGDVYYKLNRFDKAAFHYKLFLDTSPVKDYTGIATWRAAVSYQQLHLFEQSAELLKKVKRGNASIDDDVYAARKLGEIQNNMISREELVLVRFLNYIEAGDYSLASDSLKLLESFSDNNETKARIFLALSEIELKKGNGDQAIFWAKKVSEMKPVYENYTLPYSYYFQALVYKMKNDSVRMKEQLQKIEKFSDYDYSRKLKGLLTALKNM